MLQTCRTAGTVRTRPHRLARHPDQGERSRSFSSGPIALRENYGFSLRQVNRLAQSA